MIERLKESRGSAVGFKVIGKLSTADTASLSQQIAFAMTLHKRPLGILADLSEMEGASWAARWQEMRFLQRHSDHIARMAIICDDPWQEVSEMVQPPAWIHNSCRKTVVEFIHLDPVPGVEDFGRMKIDCLRL